MWIITQGDIQATKNSKITGEMYPYQLSTLGFMEKFETRNFTEKSCGNEHGDEINIKTNVGILANDSGTGKTRILLGLIANNKNNCSEDMNSENSVEFSEVMNHETGNHDSGDFFVPNVVAVSRKKFEFPENSRFSESSLVVCSQLNVQTWVREIRNNSVMRVFVIDSYKKVSAWRLSLGNPECKYEIVVCPTSFYNKLVRENEDLVWDRVILDDPEFMRGITEKVKTRFTWLVTSTPEKLPFIRNRSLLSGVYGTIRSDPQYFTIKCSEEYIQESFSYEIEGFVVKYAKSLIMSVLRSHFSPEIKKLIDEGKTEEAFVKMGGDVMSEKGIMNLYTQIIEEKIKGLGDNKPEDVQRLISRLESVKEKIKNMKNETCGVCVCELENPVMTKCCNNFICFECMRQSLRYNSSCVYCRTPTTNFVDTVLISDNTDHTDLGPIPEIKRLGLKKEECCNVINKEVYSGRKVLIFASKGIAEIISEMEKQNIEFSDLASVRNMNSIKKALDDFRGNRKNVILLGAYDTISGVSLENVNSVILYDYFSCNVIKQVLGKVARPSRINGGKINVYNLSPEQ